VANNFVSELRRAFQQIAATPAQWSPYLRGTRVFPMRGFPYLVVFVVTPTGARVIAVAHAQRRPGYWSRRLP
jgi:hypothetical protein